MSENELDEIITNDCERLRSFTVTHNLSGFL